MIITNNEEALRVKCEDVLPNEINDLISILESELSYANKLGKNGIGLAAPQIGIAKKIAIIRMPHANIELINCEIKNGYDQALFKEEGCLSFPGRVENTLRFQEVHIINNLKFPTAFIATGLLAVVCQHELDHLNSILFMERQAPVTFSKKKIKPNDECFCGSKIKYKKCCGK